MIKIECDICKTQSQPQTDKFFFEASLTREDANILLGENLQPQKRIIKTTIHLCKKCFNKYLNKPLYEEKKKN